MTQRLASKVVVVVGGSSGIGEAVARRAALEGAAVVVGARRTDIGEALAAGIRDAGGRAIFVPADATVETDMARLTRAAVVEFGRLDGAFNNAGGVCAAGPIEGIGATAWRAELELNLTSVFHGLEHQIPAMLASGGGSIVNNASLAGVGGVGGLAAYSAAKHGVVGLTRAAALECAGRGVRVNALVTGNVDTPLYRRLLGAPLVGDLDLDAPNPTGRVAQAAEIAAFVVFLLSDESAFITGAALAIDGGASAQ